MGIGVCTRSSEERLLVMQLSQEGSTAVMSASDRREDDVHSLEMMPAVLSERRRRASQVKSGECRVRRELYSIVPVRVLFLSLGRDQCAFVIRRLYHETRVRQQR